MFTRKGIVLSPRIIKKKYFYIGQVLIENYGYIHVGG